MNSHMISSKTYVLVWAILMVLLFLTWGAANINLGIFSALVALSIAVVKMLLVILIFMHVRYSSPLTWLFASIGFIWLAIMLALTMSDYATRGAVKPQVNSFQWQRGKSNHMPE
ncbi:MAG: caa(3)-type oxidase, subunit [Pedosphaera sp.]|nr:caa(3)-type oxidase, subunit [Pedosphaera sp.]